MPLWLAYCIGVMLLWGTWAFLPKISSRTLDSRSVMFYQNLGGMIMVFLVLATQKFKIKFHLAGVPVALVTGALGVLGLLFYLQAIQRHSIGVVVMVTSLYPVVTVALTVLILKDKISGVQWLGILFALCSIACMAWPNK